MAGIRAFLAVDLDDAARAEALELAQRLRGRPGGDHVRWVRSEALHVTLRFLGQMDPQRAAELTQHVAREVRTQEPFALRLGTPHPFPSARRPRVVALEIEPREPLGALADAVERGVVAAGFEPEARAFRAHLTLGRMRGGRPPQMEDLDAPRAESPVRDVVLYRSHLGRDGSRYEPLERMPLGSAGGDASPRTFVQGENEHG
ncbi:MAG: RNA 2',3'-cyclic phosphodiesterase [Deltaproteobacteria bacterium]|nr:RNA 2',3'-cyclic phosphodiesterase [Deltaproteobacteria bacterium]MBW2372085.1 RNA 2',3'-cyclic phosphodiesterase [Deltaproteobacteria bacterium]